jgi:hypothetical protein
MQIKGKKALLLINNFSAYKLTVKEIKESEFSYKY